MSTTREAALEALGIPRNHKVILSLDGGGIRGILTLQLLKRLEAQAGIPCHELFDMVAGTSTGGIIAGLIATRRHAVEIEDLYKQFVTQVFTKRSFAAGRILNPPKWTKAQYRALLRKHVGDGTLEDYCGGRSGQPGLDLLITTRDVTEGEETYLSYMNGRTPAKNTYGKALLRNAMEATMSAPTYFYPYERFVDGGSTAFNNPVLAAIIEAVQYGPEEVGRAYPIDKLTVYSFGTSCHTLWLPPEQTKNPPGPDVKFWLNWVMSESGNDASDMQSYLLRCSRILKVDYRRYQITLDPHAIRKLSNLPLSMDQEPHVKCLHDLTDEELEHVDLDNIDFFPVMETLGKAMADFICSEQSYNNFFKRDLVNPNDHKELLVTRQGDVRANQRNLADATWGDRLPA